jgi:hypothetical protein
VEDSGIVGGSEGGHRVARKGGASRLQRPWRSPMPVLFATFGLLFLPSDLVPHEIPADVTVRAFVAPDGDRLRFLVRVPLEAMRDFAFPLRGPGYLELEGLDPVLRDAAILWVADYVEFFEDGRPLGPETLLSTRISLPSDPSFASLALATAHMGSAPLPPSVDLPWKQAMLDAVFEVSIQSDSADFSVRPEFAHLGLRTVTVLRFVAPNASEQVFQFAGNPGLVRLDPRWYHAALRFVRLGFGHILDGIDHLLFLLCLVIPFRRFWALVPVVTAFTLAHSITLISSAFGVVPNGLWFPPLIEVLIAASIVYMALENMLGAKLERRWMLAFGFGLVHGFGFSFALRETLQFAGSHLLTSLLAFNVGVELGQLAVLAFTLPVLAWLFRRIPDRAGTIVLSALIAHTSVHWLTDRATVLAQFERGWPAMDPAGLIALTRWLILFLVAGGVAWWVRKPFERWSKRATGLGGDAP